MKILLPLLLLLSVAMSAQDRMIEEGIATLYNDKFHGRATASSEKYDKNGLTGAHKTLPFGSKVKVTRLDNGKSVTVKINDRGGFAAGRVIDLSRKAATELGINAGGQAKVKVEVVEFAGKPIAETLEKPEKPEKKESKKVLDEKGNLIGEMAENMETEGLYKIQVLKMDNKGFGVQVATFTNYDGVMKYVAALQESWHRNAMVYVSGSGEAAVYKIILGPFPDKETANSYSDSFKSKQKGASGFVVDLNTMK